ncbi:hypothetical protein [Nocardiopsis lambiniae]|uniref:Uncharacterized protein n=1 Tax=Nocardiopsis lambiniae TaxID=3075539 RepID=A0ABU2M8A7_9ACTN|nr:hypothetical protein [Nocardiopsis sp. DSM 44743]MDT0328898.1 hypothetical protein [Nocardiopsis sp. DSM 44743]
MPGEGARRERERRRARERSARHASGRWEILFETTDPAEMRAHRARERDRLKRYREDDLRLDVLCGRLEQDTWYRLSVFVPDP